MITWRRENGLGIGGLTNAVIDELERGTPAADTARRVREARGRRDAGNGAVMRCVPVALRWWNDGARLIEQSFASAAVTHADPRCAWSTGVTTAAIALALTGAEVPLGRLAEAAHASGAPDEVVERSPTGPCSTR